MNRILRYAGLALLLACGARSEEPDESERYKQICTSLTPTYEAAGFVCLSANSQTYLRCHLPELVWKVMECPKTLKCTADVMNWTENNPCNVPPPTYCGDGNLDEGEECEIGGYGCDNECTCELGFVPNDPVTKDCRKLPYCGDGIINMDDEQCEIGGIGCSAECKCEDGYKPMDPVSKDCVEIPKCGNGEMDEGEQCELGGNGCNDECMCQEGYEPTNPVSKDCAEIPKCGNGKIDDGEQCELGGLGCDSNCMCEEGYVPADPVSADCVRKERKPKNLYELCEWFTETDDDSGYVCLSDNSTEYLRCHLTEKVATMMSCPAGTRCRAPVDVYTVYNPCLWEAPFPIEDYVWIYGNDTRVPDFSTSDGACGNGVLDDGEECEYGGVGCNAGCQCAEFYEPADPVSMDCRLDYQQVCASLYQTTSMSTTYFCPSLFFSDNSSVVVRCDGEVPTIEMCPENAFCTADGSFETNPCAPLVVDKCGNGEMNYDEECEIGGVGCTSECKCAEGFVPASPAGFDCVRPAENAPKTSPEFCEYFNKTGFFCEKYWLAGAEASNKFVMCENDAMAAQFDCPLGTVCGRTDFTQENPCILGAVCNNGIIDEGEECEQGGYGCSECKCLPGFVPTDPVSANCKLANVTDICRENNAWVAGEDYYGCVPELSGYYVRCNADANVAVIQLCPKGTECLAGSFVTEDPCL